MRKYSSYPQVSLYFSPLSRWLYAISCFVSYWLTLSIYFQVLQGLIAEPINAIPFLRVKYQLTTKYSNRISYSLWIFLILSRSFSQLHISISIGRFSTKYRILSMKPKVHKMIILCFLPIFLSCWLMEMETLIKLLLTMQIGLKNISIKD